MDNYKKATIILSIVLVIVLIVVGGFFSKNYIINEIKEDVYKEVAVYQANKGVVLLWNGTAIIELNIRGEE